jgi:hypothetical protein
MRSPKEILGVVIPAIAAALLLTGCGSDGSSANSATATGATGASGASASPPAPTDTLLISGAPATAVVTGNAYTFKPTATDSAGNPLTFTIQNMPAWATFSAATGQMSGTPTTSSVGTYSGITIGASDGTKSAALPAFAITVTAAAVTQSPSGTATLSWTVPTQNTDGSPITNLAGFTIMYGTSPSALTQTINVASPSTTTYMVSGLGSGTWYFVVQAYNSAGMESGPSNTGSKTI